jgi:hypothetical protein
MPMTATRLFDVPDGETLKISVESYTCGICGAKAGKTTFILEATEYYSARDPEKLTRSWLHYHNPICSCKAEIWLPDGPILEE